MITNDSVTNDSVIKINTSITNDSIDNNLINNECVGNNSMTDNLQNKTFRSGTVVLIGRPSSGKSTLVNCACGNKVSIVSKAPQTTRFLIKAIYTDDDAQIIFVDTPGYHHFNSDLNRGLSNLAANTLNDGDIILYITDPSRELGEEEEDIISKVKPFESKTIIVFNKSDLTDDAYNKFVSDVNSRLKPMYSINTSALNDKNIDNLIRFIKTRLPIGPLYYPEDFVTDQDIPFRIKECVREKLFILMNDEIPHSCYVEIEKLTVNNKSIKVYASICVEKESQKGMVIGKSASMIKQIGEVSRKELIEIFEKQVNLFLNVKVHHNWRKNTNFLKKMFELH